MSTRAGTVQNIKNDSEGDNGCDEESVEDSKEGKLEKARTKSDERSDIDWRSFVGKYSNVPDFPFEIGENVWILRPSDRATLGPFRIDKALSADRFELVSTTANGAAQSVIVEEQYLRRNENALS